MKIPVDLSRHCIETGARLKLEQLIRIYFKTPDPAIEDQISLLTYFLENGDFPAMRTRFQDMADPDAALIPGRSPQKIQIRVNGRVFAPVWKD